MLHFDLFICRSDCEFINKVVKPFDWTYTTDYKGTLLGNLQVLFINTNSVSSRFFLIIICRLNLLCVSKSCWSVLSCLWLLSNLVVFLERWLGNGSVVYFSAVHLLRPQLVVDWVSSITLIARVSLFVVLLLHIKTEHFCIIFFKSLCYWRLHCLDM